VLHHAFCEKERSCQVYVQCVYKFFEGDIPGLSRALANGRNSLHLLTKRLLFELKTPRSYVKREEKHSPNIPNPLPTPSITNEDINTPPLLSPYFLAQLNALIRDTEIGLMDRNTQEPGLGTVHFMIFAQLSHQFFDREQVCRIMQC
jgi:hypothetical protein